MTTTTTGASSNHRDTWSVNLIAILPQQLILKHDDISHPLAKSQAEKPFHRLRPYDCYRTADYQTHASEITLI